MYLFVIIANKIEHPWIWKNNKWVSKPQVIIVTELLHKRGARVQYCLS